MSSNYVHYDPATGAIRQISTGGAPVEIAGYAVAEFTNVTYWEILDTTKWRVAVKALQRHAGELPRCELVKVN